MLKKNPDRVLKVFVDIDGVLGDWQWGVHNLLGLHHITTENYHQDNNQYANEYYDGIRNYQKRGGEFWYDLPELPHARKLWDCISRYKHAVITAIGSNDLQAASQKKRWMLRHFAEEHVIVIERTREKCYFAKPNHILIDDQTRAIDGWVERGGIGILFEDVDTVIKNVENIFRTHPNARLCA